MFIDPILEAFDERARRCPEAPLVVSRQHNASVADIDRLSRTVAGWLERAQISPGSLVGLAATNGVAFLAGLLALRRVGAAALLLDGRTPEAEKLRTTGALAAVAILACPELWPRGDDFSLTHLTARPVAAASTPALAPDVAVVKLTSGSTGSPRGIVTPSAALVADDAALAVTMELGGAEERILAAIPMSHSYGLSSVAMPALMRGSVLVVPETKDPLDPMRAARACGVTFLPTVPAYLQALVKAAHPPRSLPSLRRVISAGAPLRPATALRFRELYGLPVQVFYGASECGGITFDRTGTAGERGSLGTPVEGVRLTLEPAPASEADAAAPVNGETPAGRGVVTVTSPAVARGYFPVADPSLADGCFRTRDLGVLCGGELYLEARLDELINVRGKKVDPREVESVLSQLAGVEDVVTLGVVLPGQEERIVRSFVACRPGQLSCETVQSWCRRHLADYKVPRSIILLDEIPRTARGKLDREALLALAAVPRPPADPSTPADRG